MIIKRKFDTARVKVPNYIRKININKIKKNEEIYNRQNELGPLYSF